MARYAFRGRKRWWHGKWRLIAILLGSLAVALIRYLPSNVPDTVDGVAQVIDGDSLRVNGEEIRLVGLDAPESGQTCLRDGRNWRCGRAAGRALRAFLGGRKIQCDIEGLDKYDRLLGVCLRGKRDINSWLVEQGWAVSYGDYRSEEARARSAKRGIWASEFVEPREWRDEHLSGAVAAAAS